MTPETYTLLQDAVSRHENVRNSFAMALHADVGPGSNAMELPRVILGLDNIRVLSDLE